jgi:hypothetical protein
MFNLTTYQKYLLVAYFIGIIVQVFALYILAQIYCNELDFGHSCAILYIVFASIQFVLFLKIIEEKS